MGTAGHKRRRSEDNPDSPYWECNKCGRYNSNQVNECQYCPIGKKYTNSRRLKNVIRRI